MRKISLFLILFMIIFYGYGTPGNTTTLIDTLNKQFKKQTFPFNKITTIISIETKVDDLSGPTPKKTLFRTFQIHKKAVNTFIQNGWNTNSQFFIDTINVGKIELKIGEGMNLKFDKTLRLKAFVHQCDHPMKKYRGGDINEFFRNKVLKKAEECLKYNNQLQEGE